MPPSVPSPSRLVQGLGSRESCQGRVKSAALSAALALTVCATGCEYTAHTTVKVRDPSAVRFDVDDGKGERTILPAGASAEQTVLPSSHPPFTDTFEPPTSIQRLPGGPIEVRCEDCTPRVEALLPMTGVVELGEDLRLIDLDWTKKEMRLHFVDLRSTAYAGASFEATLATPWANVESVRRVSTPDRALGLKLLVSGGIAAVLGTFAVVDGANNKRTSTLAFGVPLLVLTVPLVAGGAWYSFAAPREQELYPGAAPAPAAPR